MTNVNDTRTSSIPQPDYCIRLSHHGHFTNGGGYIWPVLASIREIKLHIGGSRLLYQVGRGISSGKNYSGDCHTLLLEGHHLPLWPAKNHCVR